MKERNEQTQDWMEDVVYSGGDKREAKLTKAKHRVFRSAVLTVLLLTFATAAVYFGTSFGWLSPPSRDVGAHGSGVTSEGIAATVGYDVYKYDEDDLNENGDVDEGININASRMTMNLYDQILLGRNDRTPLILRAVLSEAYKYEVEQNNKKVMLTVKCASKSTTREDYDIDGDGVLEKVDWLSNVVSVCADYIPEIIQNIENGTIPKNSNGEDYKSVDDYIYHAAIDHFANDYIYDPVRFLGDIEQTAAGWEETSYVITEVKGTGNLGNTAQHTEREDGMDVTYKYVVEGYLISDGNGNFLGMNTDRTATANYSPSFSAGTQYTEAEWNTMKAETAMKYSLWTMNGSTSTTLYNQGAEMFLDGARTGNWWNYTYTLSTSATDNNLYWTIYNNNNNLTFFRRNCYIRYNNNGSWIGSNSGTNCKVYKVEKCTRIVPDHTVIVHNKTMTIPVNLDAALGADGNYYMYFLIDYEPNLVTDYMNAQGMEIQIGAEASAQYKFEDIFDISVVLVDA